MGSTCGKNDRQIVNISYPWMGEFVKISSLHLLNLEYFTMISMIYITFNLFCLDIIMFIVKKFKLHRILKLANEFFSLLSYLSVQCIFLHP